MTSPTGFVITREYQRFVEFCAACRARRYIGLCFGPPGVGKTLSAMHYTNWDQVTVKDPYLVTPKWWQISHLPPMSRNLRTGHTVYCVPTVMATPSSIGKEIAQARLSLHEWQKKHVHDEFETELADAHERLVAAEDAFRKEQRYMYVGMTRPPELELAERHFLDVRRRLSDRLIHVRDPTELVIIDEADRLRMTALEHVRDLYDRDSYGLILIGMPGIEKRLARYPHIYSRVGFVHEFRGLSAEDVRELLTRWRPNGVKLEQTRFSDEESVASIMRAASGNFRLLDRLLTQVARLMEINNLSSVTSAVVDAARESLVIGAG